MTYHCGGELTESVAKSYFIQLRDALDKELPSHAFDRFVGERFNTHRNGRDFVYVREEVVPVTPARISREDWAKIAALGFDGLSDGGYRGCMLNYGKVWFQGDGDNFWLSAIDHDMNWES
ncbi:hypothetical protein [Erythrobacter sp. YT30]|uniref:hypothetical protein n=1 Tax=Erythrobacter sp. YT30 TaxID=1735012 RepID=UPI0012E3F922|nr:hypothetical protein [Erythrobacter sp. YT30]